MTAALDIAIQRDVPIPTWFAVGGRADRFAAPKSHDELRRCVELDPDLRILGEGANLLVDDAGVSELVVSLADPAFSTPVIEPTGRVLAPAGADLRQLMNETVRRGLGGLETLAGIPASVGGAAVMNAGGAFGQFADHVTAVHAIDRAGRAHAYPRSRIDFGYRTSGLTHLIITAVEFQLTPGDPAALRQKLLEVSNYKKQTQPLAANSAGCAFKNPTILNHLRLPTGEEFAAGTRASAGLLIDRAGCKGLRLGSASVSQLHANFLTADPNGRAADVIALIAEVARRVRESFGVTIEPEVAIWRRQPSHTAQ